MVPQFVLLAAAAIAFAPMAAQAQNFRCTGKDGKKYYGSVVPPQCIGQPYEQLNRDGNVVRRFDPEGDEKQRLIKEAEAEKKRKEDDLAREANRRNRALLATYSTEKDIDEARARALVDNEKQIKDIEGRIAALKKRQAGFDKEMEFYQEVPASKDKKGKSAATAPKQPKIPPKLAEEMKNTEIDLKAQEGLLEAKKKDVDNINAKYDEDKKRFLELTGKK